MRAPSLRLCLLALLFLPLFCLASARADDLMPEVDLWPLLYYDRDMDSGAKQLELLWPIGGWDKDSKQSSIFVRPLFNRRADLQLGERESVVLHPIIGSRLSRKGYSETRSLYIFKQVSEQTNGDSRSSVFLLPFFGVATRNGSIQTAMLWPVFGTMNGMFGRDRLLFVAWPLFSYERIGDARKYNVLQPFFAYRTGNGGGYKFWPLYGYRNDKRGLAWFCVWPLFVHERAKLQQGGERVSYLSWPLWYQEDSPGGYQRAVVWPLFKYTYEKRTERRRLDAPWPIFMRETDNAGSVLRILPLIIYRTSAGATDISALWPIFWWNRQRNAGNEMSSFRMMPFLWFADWKRDGRESSVAELWPVVKHLKGEDGSTFTEVPTLTWSSHNELYERNLAPFFRMIEYRTDTSGGREFRLLWRLIRWQSKPDSWFGELTPLAALYNKENGTGEGRFRFTLLKGLFDYRKIGDRTSVRLLWVIPL